MLTRREFIVRGLLGSYGILSGAEVRSFAERVLAAAAPPVRLGYQLNIYGALAIVALETGAFRRRGVTVRATGFGGGVEARTALLAGSVDIATMATTPFITAVSAGPYAGVAAGIYGGNTNAVVVAVRSPIRDLRDLKGRKIASQKGSGSDKAFRDFVMPSAGLGPDDYSIVNVRFPDHVGVLQAGLVDAFVGVEPFVTLAEVMGIGRVLVDFGNFDPNPGFLVAPVEWIDSQAQVLSSFLEVWVDTYEFSRREPKKFAEVIRKFYAERGTELSGEVVEKLVQKLDLYPGFLGGLRDYLAQESDAMLRRGEILRRVDWNKALRGEVVTDLLKKRGLLQARRLKFVRRY